MPIVLEQLRFSKLQEDINDKKKREKFAQATLCRSLTIIVAVKWTQSLKKAPLQGRNIFRGGMIACVLILPFTGRRGHKLKRQPRSTIKRLHPL